MKLSEHSAKLAEQLTLDPAKPISEQKPSRFRSFLQKFYPSKPETMPSAQALESFKFATIDFQTEKGKKMIYTIFRRNSLTFKSVKTKAAIAIPSISFKYNNPKEEAVVNMFLNNLHPASGLLQLTSILRDLYIDTTAFGTGYLDPIWNKKKTMIDGLKKIHPISMDLLRDSGFGEGGEVKLDKSGNPVGWIQRINNKTKELSFENVAYLTFNIIGDEWLGISDLEPIYQNVWRLMNIEEGIATAIFRHGFPLYDIKVSGASEGRPPTKEQLEEAAKEVTGLNYKSEFVHGPNYTIKLLEAFSMGKSQDYVEPFIDQVIAISDLPKFVLLGSSEDLSKASASELIKFIKPLLRPSKDKLKLFFEEQILQPLMKTNHINTVPQLIIGDVKLLDSELESEKDIGKSNDINKNIITDKGTDKKEDNPKPKEELKKEDDKYKPKTFKPKKLPEISLLENKGKLLLEGHKKQIVKSKKEEKTMKKLIGKESYLMEGDKQIAIIKLREPRLINLNELVQLEYAHQISSEEAMTNWPGESEFFVYEFDMIKKL